jgi:hypothetical protein
MLQRNHMALSWIKWKKIARLVEDAQECIGRF